MELGWTLVKRKAHLNELAKNGVVTRQKLEFQDKMQLLPLVNVPIGLPKYRLFNGRTASLQEEWLSEHPEKSEDFFRRDPELLEAQKIQHELLSKLTSGAGLFAYFKDAANKQTDFVILDANGFVINGNRRLCAWRTLLTVDETKYAHFGHIEALLLPPADDRAIDRLEGQLQIEPEIRDDYTWDSLANMMKLRKQLHKLDDEALASFYKMTERQVKDLQEMLDYASVYLESRGKAKHWSVVSDKEYAFRKMIERRKNFGEAGAKKLFEECAFALIDDPTGRRLYESIPDLQKHFQKVRARLVERFPVPKAGQAPAGADDDLFGVVDEKVQSDLRLAEEIGKAANVSDAALLIKDVIDSERQLKKDEDNANYVLKRLQGANSEVQSALAGIRADTNKIGVIDQLNAIEEGLTKLREWTKS